VNPGDRLVINLAGPVRVDALSLTVDSEGKIFIPNVGAVTVGGQPYGNLHHLIEQRVSRVYRNFTLDVSIGQLHGITVYVTGFAATPGSYTISSLSTLVNAVLAAGGPSSGGSFRSIQVKRAGVLVSDFDLYDLLLRGDKRGDVPLQNDDVIYIAPAGPQVAVIGSVNNEAIFEARPNDSLGAVLAYAGGANTVADESRALVLDSVKSTGGWEQLTLAETNARPAKRGEVVRVLSAVDTAKPLEQLPVLVTVSGEVRNPGHFYFAPGVRLSEVMAKAGGLTSSAFAYASVITRERIKLQQRDSFRQAVEGVQLSLTAGPITDASRTHPLDPAELTAVQSLASQLEHLVPDGRLVLDLPVSATALPPDMVMENNDTIYVPPKPTFVGVFGMVHSPASFGYDGSLTVGDYVAKAGGISKLGDKSQIFVVRASGAVLAKGRGRFAGGILRQPIYPGDLIYVPINPDRGRAWARVRDLAGVLSGLGVTAAAVKGLTN